MRHISRWVVRALHCIGGFCAEIRAELVAGVTKAAAHALAARVKAIRVGDAQLHTERTGSSSSSSCHSASFAAEKRNCSSAGRRHWWQHRRLAACASIIGGSSAPAAPGRQDRHCQLTPQPLLARALKTHRYGRPEPTPPQAMSPVHRRRMYQFSAPACCYSKIIETTDCYMAIRGREMQLVRLP